MPSENLPDYELRDSLFNFRPLAKTALLIFSKSMVFTLLPNLGF